MAFFPRNGAPTETVVLVDPGGGNAQWNEDSLAQYRAGRQQCAVVAPDLRGIGDLRGEFPRHHPNHARSHQEEEAYAWACLMLGRPLLSQRVPDLRAVIRATGGPVRLAARGVMTVPALLALSSEVKSAYFAGGIPSYRALLDQEEPSFPLAYLAFGAPAGGRDLPTDSRVRHGREWTAAAILG